MVLDRRHLQTFDVDSPSAAPRTMWPMLDCLSIQNGKITSAGYVQYVLLEV